MNNEKRRCPYCSRKINYGRRLLEAGNGEYKCKNCKKISNIKHNSLIWIILTLCCLFAVFIMIFYFSSAKDIQNTYDDTGKMKFLVTLFFGDFKEIKWILWEIFPFVVFYFISPLFVEFAPQKRFMEQTQTQIDLSVPIGNVSSKQKEKNEQKKKTAQKEQTNNADIVYEDISSSSSDIDKTRAFRVSDVSSQEENNSITEENMTDINRNSVSNSYSSDTPLVKVSHNPLAVADEDIKEYIPSKERQKDDKPAAPEKKTPPANYSANRKF